MSTIAVAYKEDAIVVLGCGLLKNKSTARILEAIEECDPDTKYIIFSGRGIYEQPEHEYLKQLYYEYNYQCLAIPITDAGSYTTLSNAKNVIDFFLEKDIKSSTIVTSEDHFYAPLIFNAINFIKGNPAKINFVFTNYTRND
jgi:3-dehydroquinate synthetase